MVSDGFRCFCLANSLFSVFCYLLIVLSCGALVLSYECFLLVFLSCRMSCAGLVRTRIDNACGHLYCREMQDVLHRHNFEYSIYGLTKIVGRANTRMLQRRQRQHYQDEGAFAVAVGMSSSSSPAARLRHVTEVELTTGSSTALLRTSTGRRQAGFGGLLELDEGILVLVRSFLAAQRWTLVNVWKAHAKTTFDCDMAQHAVASASNDHTLKVWAEPEPEP